MNTWFPPFVASCWLFAAVPAREAPPPPSCLLVPVTADATIKTAAFDPDQYQWIDQTDFGGVPEMFSNMDSMMALVALLPLLGAILFLILDAVVRQTSRHRIAGQFRAHFRSRRGHHAHRRRVASTLSFPFPRQAHDSTRRRAA